ncbi:MAG: S8 family serine peptidase, partial [Actinobacteria bacterium]|nr:S8 family serine peptidase [Actinomycetota bacterium]
METPSPSSSPSASPSSSPSASPWSSPSASPSATPSATASESAGPWCPQTPTGLTAVPGDNSAVLAWDLPLEDEATALTGYEATVYSIEDPADTQKATFAASALAATITGLRNGRVYQVVLKAQNAVGLSAPTEAVEVRPTNGIDGEVSRLVVEYETGVASVEAPLVATGSDVIDEVGLEPGKALGDGLMTVELTEPVSIADAEAIAEVLTADPRIVSAEPDQVVTTASFPETSPNDAQFAGQQWNLWGTYGIGAAETPNDMTTAYSTAQGAGVRVAVIDTGITRHEDFGNRLLPGYDFVSSYPELKSSREAVPIGSDPATNAVSFDGDYVATDTYGELGWDNNPADPGDWRGVAPVRNSSWHGTNIAGIIGAEANNSIGIVGVAPKVEIQPIRALSWRGGLLSDVAASITWASGGVVPEVAENPTPANVINLSFSTEGMCTPALQTAIDGALSRGVTVVAAAGNANDDVSKYAPANCDGVISVGASDRNGKRAGYSNFGIGIDISAPGGDANGDGSAGVFTLSNTGAQAPLIDGYAYTQGTSVSAAHVTGALARLVELNPESTPSELSFILTGAGNVKHFAQDSCDIDPLKTCGPGIVQIASNTMTNTFNYTGAVQTWTVPAGITSVYVEALGANGGLGGGGSRGGARVQGTLAVTPGETLSIYVGGGGGAGSAGAAGGWNGGGNGQGTYGAGGGGATDIRQGGTAVVNRVIIAGGAGGGGFYGGGGAAGFPSGSAGVLCSSTWTSCVNNSSGGTQSAGGTNGVGANTSGSNAGGGGGGYFGGGAGATNAAGAGGSSYSSNAVTSVTHTAQANATNSAHGSLTITTTVPSLTPTDLTAAGFTRSVDLSWTPWSFDAVTGYRIKWGTDPASMTNQIDVNSPASTFRHQSQNVLAITNKALTSNVATLTTSTAHGLAVGDVVVVEGVGSPFNGTVTVTTVPTSTTFKFALTSVNVTSSAVNPTGIAQKQLSLPVGTTFYYKIAARYTDTAQSCNASCFSAYTSPVVSAATVFANGTIFEYTGAPVAYTVPDGVSWLQVDSQGGQGGTAGTNGYSGGLGGRARATIPVTAGETLFVYVGGSGGGVTRTYDTSLTLPFTYSSGWNGGGTGNNTNAG